MSYMLQKSIELVKERVPIFDVARQYTQLKPLSAGLNARDAGAWYTARCPMPDHNDETPSFYIYPPGRWHCYGCHAHGDVIDLEHICGEHIEMWSAIVALATKFDIELPRRPKSWCSYQEQKAAIERSAQGVRKSIRRKRLFELLILPDFQEYSDPNIHSLELTRAWREWNTSMTKIGL